ncbi:UNVERIFIED_CONTAM: hypothetical protein GTU68_029824 [Idotea baltica]|nr:hypothetical protein [Idotea baltica]
MRKKWLTYWIVFAFATVFDKFLSYLLFFLPAFYAFKVLFFVWLFYPRTDGAALIYQKLVRPNLKRLSPEVKKLHQS